MYVMQSVKFYDDKIYILSYWFSTQLNFNKMRESIEKNKEKLDE